MNDLQIEKNKVYIESIQLLLSIKIKHGEQEQSWNKNNGKCVFDYLIHLYGKTKGFIKIMNYTYLNNEFGDDALNNGVSINQIDIFCKKYDISYYALDQDEKTIKYYIPKNSGGIKSLIFRLLNGHMYPIENETKRRSIVAKHRKDIKYVKSVKYIKSIHETIKNNNEIKNYEIIDVNTQITSKKYKNIGELLKQKINCIISCSINEKNDNIRGYLFEWLYLNHYRKKEMEGNLTTRIKNINNKPCYYYIIKNIFNNIDILQYCKTTKEILNNDCINFIKKLHIINASLTGTFLDYLIRRIISEKTKNIFFDSKANFICGYKCKDNFDINVVELLYSKKPLSIEYNYLKFTRDTTLYKSETILSSIFITSLSHSLSFCGYYNEEQFNDILNLIQNTTDIIELFYMPLNNFCTELLSGKTNILLNPGLGNEIPSLDNKKIKSDCDIVIDDILYDIKCTIGDNSIYEILQLLGYASLLQCNPKFNKKINNISVINLLKGHIINYDISYITEEQMINYLKILTK